MRTEWFKAVSLFVTLVRYWGLLLSIMLQLFDIDAYIIELYNLADSNESKLGRAKLISACAEKGMGITKKLRRHCNNVCATLYW